MEARYTDDYPDVKKLKETIAALEKLKKDMAAQAREDVASDNASTSQIQAGMPILQLKTQMKINRAEMDQANQQSQRLQQAGASLSGAAECHPRSTSGDGRYHARPREHAEAIFRLALARSRNRRLATSLEMRQEGAQFRIIDPPSLPDKPEFPDRFKFSLAAIGAGIALAILFGFGSEFLDDRIRGEQALSEATSLPVLAEIPPLPTPKELRWARLAPWMAVACDCC